MTMSATYRLGGDVFDSRDVIERIEELEMETEGCTVCDRDGTDKSGDTCTNCHGEGEIVIPENAEELAQLRALVDEIDAYAGDSARDGVGLIADRYFTRYAQELAEEIGAIDPSASWPNDCIDWERATRQLKMDYSEIETPWGVYWVRS